MRRARSSALVALAALFGVAGACSNSQRVLGHGDNLVEDVDASDATAPLQGDDASFDDGFFAPVDSGYPPPPDGYAPFAWCTQCGCPSDTFCFGGGSGHDTFSGDCHVEGGALTSSADLSVGCYPFPSACANEPSCECLISAVSQYMPCYPVCSITTNIVYCPNP
jgi:hypothetical protein